MEVLKIKMEPGNLSFKEKLFLVDGEIGFHFIFSETGQGN